MKISLNCLVSEIRLLMCMNMAEAIISVTCKWLDCGGDVTYRLYIHSILSLKPIESMC